MVNLWNSIYTQPLTLTIAVGREHLIETKKKDLCSDYATGYLDRRHRLNFNLKPYKAATFILFQNHGGSGLRGWEAQRDLPIFWLKTLSNVSSSLSSRYFCITLRILETQSRDGSKLKKKRKHNTHTKRQPLWADSCCSLPENGSTTQRLKTLPTPPPPGFRA